MHPFWIALVFVPGIVVALGLAFAMQTNHAGIDHFGLDRGRLKIVIPFVAAFGPVVLTLLLLESALRRTDELFMTWLRGGGAKLPGEATLPPTINNKADAAAQVGMAYLTLLDSIRQACQRVGIDASQLTASQALDALVARVSKEP